MSGERVLVTGSAGVIGSAVCKALSARGHWVRGFDVKPTPGVPDARTGSVADAAAMDTATAGMSTLVHLAATVNDADFLPDLLPNNILGVYHVLESARRHKLRRVVLASSIQAVGGIRHPDSRPVCVSDGIAPANMYGVTKVFAEAAGYCYAVQHGLSVVAVRIAWLPRTAADAEAIGRHGAQAAYLSRDDAGRLFVRCVEAEPVKYALVFGVSRNRGTPAFDPEPARRLLGFEPQDDYPAGLPSEWGIA